MAKVTVGHELIYDRCPQCGGEYLDRGEREALERKAYDRGRADGEADRTATTALIAGATAGSIAASSSGGGC